MVERSAEVAAVFHSLADPTRIALVERLAVGEAALTELARPMAMSLAAVQKHVRVLEAAGVVATRKEGRERRCRLEPDAFADAASWLRLRREAWERRFDSLDELLASEAGCDD